MRIAHVTPVYPPYKGGMGEVAREYAEGLRELGVDVQVFTPAYAEYSTAENVSFLKSIFHFGKAAILPQLVWKLRGFDVIHLHYPFYGADIFTAIAARLWKIPLVTTYHMKTQGSGLLGRLFRWHRIFLEPIVFALTNSMLVSSLDYAQSIGLRHRALKELPFSVDTSRFFPGRSLSVRQKYDIAESTCVFLFVGGLDDAHYFKGVDVLLRACVNLPQDKDWKVFIVGGGNRKIYLEKIAQELHIEKLVIFTDRISHEDLPEYYRASDVHVLPSIDQSEAFGLVTLEAAASGLPSIVSNLPGVRTLVVSKETGLHIEPKSSDELRLAMEDLLLNANKRTEFGKNANKRVIANYSLEKCLNHLQDVYKKSTL